MNNPEEVGHTICSLERARNMLPKAMRDEVDAGAVTPEYAVMVLQRFGARLDEEPLKLRVRQ